ncbi:MAG: AAA family ATPase [Chromatiales bacterium]
MITVVANLKGGTGKSTVAFNLAVWLATHHRNVSVVDLDPQGTLADVAAVRAEEGYEPVLKVERERDALTKKAKGREYLVDVGVADMSSMNHVLSKADRVMVPVAPSQADVWSTQRFVAMIDDANKGRKKRPDVWGFINRADTHRHVRETDEAEEALKSLKGIDLIDLRLYQRTAYRRAFSEGLAVFELEPRGKAATEINQLAAIIYSSLFILKSAD